ncbi:hypothetical protein CDD80_4971 [Ophiocordyceps camponoti-rufipedis]|uniref:Spindle assembly checkpoint component MAD1 n=1 Tax=Ophiocordyceps camponoti-rufipedis TaxID=2004952 RepID=A0A2C5YQN3_9HYPO|nr:hypothetical protein CDD80_4971 [Ophiocordyceps camponoti-rufipedis]
MSSHSPPGAISRELPGSLAGRMQASPSARPPSLTPSRRSYNLISDTSPRQSYAADAVRPGSRESFKENMAPLDADEYEKYRKEVEALKAEIGTLQYRMHTAEQEKDIVLSQQASRVEQARRREQDEAQRRQVAEARSVVVAEQLDALRKDADALRESAEEQNRALERKAREARDEAALLREQLEDLSAAKDEAARIADRRTSDLQMQLSAMGNAARELEKANQEAEEALQQARAKLVDRDGHVAELEADVLRLKARSGDAETMELIRRELSEQVQHIRSLEATVGDQSAELKQLRPYKKTVQIVEEEKRSLQRRLESAVAIEAELAETRLQRQRLQDERLAWSSYLENASIAGSDEFDSPAAVARALVQERLTTASYVEQLGGLRAELAAQESAVQALTDERHQLEQRLAAGEVAARAASKDGGMMRVNRQRELALKEVEYLRAQLKAVDDEDRAMQPERFDEARIIRIRELEALVDQYKAEIQAVHTELSKSASSSSSSAKRPHEAGDGDTQQQQVPFGQLTRKNRRLQEELASAQTRATLLEKDLSACQEQLSAAKKQSQTRVLSLRSNPTSDHEAVQRSTLDALRRANAELLATVRNSRSASTPTIPTSVLAAMESELTAAKAETASAQKSARRLKEVWAAKSLEFKEAIFSTLGWTVTFIPNGKMRVESTFYPSRTDEHENSIVFDGERGTMKVGGGPRSEFAKRIADQIGFWVREKGCIPGFLAALTLEFYEERSRVSG